MCVDVGGSLGLRKKGCVVANRSINCKDAIAGRAKPVDVDALTVKHSNPKRKISDQKTLFGGIARIRGHNDNTCSNNMLRKGTIQ